MKTLSSRSFEVSDTVKNLIARASGSIARDPDDSFSYLVAGRTMRAIFGYSADATSERTKASLVEYADRVNMSAGEVPEIRPASYNAET
jgi:hypothetical protein